MPGVHPSAQVTVGAVDPDLDVLYLAIDLPLQRLGNAGLQNTSL